MVQFLKGRKSRRGARPVPQLLIGLLSRGVAVDEGDEAKVERLGALIRDVVDRLAIDALMPEAA